MTSKIVVNNIEADAGVSTVTFNSNVERGSSNLHSTGLALGAGSTVGAVTGVTTYYGDGSQLTGISADVVDDTSPQLGGDLDTNTKNIKFGDSASHGASGDDTLIFGADDDMRMYHDGSNGYISNNTGAFVIQDSHAGANAVIIRKGAEVELLHNNVLACETSANGLAFPNGKGIDFSAASGDTAGMTGELLNDYEEGTWTPEIKGTTGAGTASYSNQTGRYLKIGNWVYLTWVTSWSSGSAGGEMRTTGLPFVPATNCSGIGNIMFNNVSIHSNTSNIAVYVGPGSNYTYNYCSRSSSGWITVNYSSSGNLIANVSFRVA